MPNGLLAVPPSKVRATYPDRDIKLDDFVGYSFHDVTKKPLFTQAFVDNRGNPAQLIHEVNQRNLGDCWILGTLIGILLRPNGPEWIMNMMRDNGDGTVTVRLFSREANPQPHYIRVQKRVPEMRVRRLGNFFRVEKLGVLHSGPGVWAAMIEKAMATLDKNNSYRPADHGANYKQLEGGEEDVALKIIIGYQNHELDRIRMPERKPLMFEDYRDELQVNIDGDAPWVPAAQERWKELTRDKNAKEKLLRREHAIEFFDDLKQNYNASDDEIAQTSLARNLNVLPGKRFSSNYSARQIAIHDRLLQYLTQNRILVTGTNVTVGKGDGEVGFGGEAKSKGLAGRHVYALKNAYIEGAIRYVEVINPWGIHATGAARHYNAENKPVAKEAGHADSSTSKVELYDFDKRFSGVSAGVAITENRIDSQRTRDAAPA